MNKTKINLLDCFSHECGNIFKVGKIACRLRVLAFAATALMGFVLPSLAQTAVINPITKNYWIGANTTNRLGAGNNTVTFTSPDASTFNFAVSGQPTGLTTLLSTNLATNTVSLGLTLFVTNIAAGAYPLTISGSGGSYPSYSTNVNFFVVPQWAITNAGSSNVWSLASAWSGGLSPTPSDGVYIEHMFNATSFTNVVDTSQSIQSLVYIGDADDNSGTIGVNTIIPDGITLSVLGTNGFFVGCKANNNTRPNYLFSGGGTLVVSNALANFAVANGASSSSTRPVNVNMTNLNNLVVTVNRFGAGDATLNLQGLIGGAEANFFLAKTNTIKTGFVADYTALDFDCAFQFECNKDLSTGSVNPTFNLGLTNGFYVDSMAVGRSKGTSGVNLTGGGATFRFSPAIASSVAPTATAYFHNTNGGRMSLVAAGVDTGLPGTALNITVGTIDLRGGIVDMLVDQIWAGHNRTNAGTFNNLGAFIFDWGTVNANIIRLGYNQFTNTANVQGFLVVGTNGTLNVNNNIELGHTPSDVTGFTSFEATASGQIQINNGGVIYANQINVGQFSTNNAITINGGGTLDITNTVADSTKRLTTLNVNGGALSLHLNGASTPIFVTNLTVAPGSKINISSVVSAILNTPIPVISYLNGTTPNNMGWGGIAPFGVNVSVSATSGNSIDVTLTTGTPKSLKWVGDLGGGVWNTSTTNWIDLATGLRTNFSTGDGVIFDDSASNSTVTLGTDIVPSQSGTGIAMTNNTLAYTFSGSGRILGGASLVKQGTGTLEIDSYTEISAHINAGALAGSGTVGSAVISSGAAMNWFGVNVLGGVTSAGYVTNSGTISGGVALQPGGVLTNAGTINGSFSTGNGSGSLLVNLVSGNMASIGNSTIGTNCTVINHGIMDGLSLTVNAGGTLEDTGEGYISLTTTSGTGTLTIGAKATFIPGGDGLGNTFVFANGGPAGTFPGRIVFAAGSTNVFKINLDTPANTILYSGAQSFGGNQSQQSISGGTLKMVLLGSTPYAAGQSFLMFESSSTLSPPISSAGTNTANSFPVMDPPAPGTGLAWDLRDLMTNGIIRIRGVATTLTNLGFVPTFATITTTNSTNYSIVSQISWPDTNIGWRLQQQQGTLATGLGTNWSDIFASYWTNNAVITNNVIKNQVFFWRMIYP